jgi:hypothetical protein
MSGRVGQLPAASVASGPAGVAAAEAAAGVAPAELPVGLAAMAPGPELAVALAGVDLTRLTAHQLVVVVAAHNRQVAYQQGQMLAAVRELGLAPPSQRQHVVRDPERNAYATVEAAFAATWTSYRCGQLVELAEFAFAIVPTLGAALVAGRVDLDKVKVFSRALEQVAEPEVIREVVERALAGAGSQTTAMLRERLQRLLAKADPDSLRKRRERDHRDRFVWRFPEPGGMVTLQARFCQPAAAAAAYDHLDTLARATRAAGEAHGRTMDQLRHDIALSLLAGVDPATAGRATPADRKGTIVMHVELATLIGARALPGRGLCGLGGLCGAAGGSSGCGLCRQALADLADQPGQLSGHGAVPAYLARQIVAEVADVSRWRFVVDDDGQVIAEGALPRPVIAGIVESMRRWSVDATAGPDGRAHYQPSAAQIAFVRARDRRCQAPGCRVPAHTCQIDHRLPWHRGGPTFVENLHCLCHRHHRAKDDGGHHYRRVAGGIEWTTATGHRYHKPDEDRHRPPHRRGHARGATWPGHAPHQATVTVDVDLADHAPY